MSKSGESGKEPLWSDTEGIPVAPATPDQLPPPTEHSTGAEGTGKVEASPQADPTKEPPPSEAQTTEIDTPSQDPAPGADQGSTQEGGSASVPSGTPQLVNGVDLIGEYEDSGYKEPHYIARRPDGQMIQLSYLLHLVAEQIDGRRGYDDIAKAVTGSYGKNVSADNVKTLVEGQLTKLGIAVPPGQTPPKVEKPDPMLALRFKTAVIPEGVTRAITVLFKPLFWPPVVLAVVVAFVALDIWLFFGHGVAQSARELIYQPHLLLMVFGMVILATAFHECGHATACAYGGAAPGVMGAGIYIVWPAFYTDVTDAYRLNRAGRLRTDLGGVYFNAIFALATFGIYVLTGFEPLLLIILLQNFVVIQQMLPLLRMDGYYILADLTGVPDLFMRIRPTLRSLIPWRKTDESVTELKPWVRVVVTLWVLILIPFLLYIFGTILFSAPRLVATAVDSLRKLGEKASDAFGSGDTVTGIARGAQMGALVLPLAGLTYTALRTAKRAATGLWNWTEDHPVGRALAALTILGALAAAGFALGPGGDYTPIGPDDRGTVQDSFRAFETVPEGIEDVTEGSEDPAPVPTEDTEDEEDPANEDPAEDEEEETVDEEEADATPTPTPSS